MQSAQAQNISDTIFDKNRTISFPEGIPAFESATEFILITNEEEAPFLWLQAASTSNFAFITIDPFLVFPEYRPDIAEEDVKILELNSEEEAFVLCIVTIHNQSHAITTNLVSPIIINWKKRLGKQVILRNHLDYSVRHLIEQE